MKIFAIASMLVVVSSVSALAVQPFKASEHKLSVTNTSYRCASECKANVTHPH